MVLSTVYQQRDNYIHTIAIIRILIRDRDISLPITMNMHTKNKHNNTVIIHGLRAWLKIGR